MPTHPLPGTGAPAELHRSPPMVAVPLALLVASFAPQDEAAPLVDPWPVVLVHEEIRLTVDRTGLELGAPDPLEPGSWRTEFGGTVVKLQPVSFTFLHLGLAEPDAITTTIALNAPSGSEVVSRTVVEGPFGAAGFASLLRQRYFVDGTDEVESEVFALAGTHAELEGWYYVAVSEGPLSKSGAKELEKFLTSKISCDAPLRDTQWTDAQIEQLIARDFPEGYSRQKLRTTRTDHFVIVGDGAAVKRIAAIFEDHYDLYMKTFGLEVEGDRMLLPVYFFESEDVFEALCVKHGFEVERSVSEGVARGEDWIAVHPGVGTGFDLAFAASHHLTFNHVFLSGGGAWFTSGLAGHMQAVMLSPVRRRHLDVAERARKDGRFIGFEEIVGRTYLDRSSNPGDGSSSLDLSEVVAQAGCMIEAVLHSKDTKKKSGDYLLKMGLAPRRDVAHVSAELRRLFDLRPAAFEALWLDYFERPAKKI